ncbi:MAG: HD domain-containing protein [Phycisphaerales bacterium]|nr:HD domain-containing protein [Phycisphaerales bacterium]
MTLARALRLSHKMLLPADRVLTRSDVTMLTERRPELYVSVHSPELDSVCEFEPDALEIGATQSVCDTASSALHLAQGALEGKSRLREDDLRVAERSIRQIDRFLCHHRIVRVRFHDEIPGIASAADGVKAVHVAMVLGAAVRLQVLAARQRSAKFAGAVNLVPLGLAALLRDCSLWTARRSLDHPGPLTTAERDIVYDHSMRSAALLPDTVDPTIYAAVLHHHENHSGTGYPRGLSRDAIPLFARILRIADAFCAATSETSYHAAKPAWLAAWEMTCGPYAECYDPGIRKIFQAVIQPYPIGSKLRLSCGRYAVVVKHGRVHGLLPEVVIAFDENDKPLATDAIQGPFRLERSPELRVVSFRDTDVTRIYGSEPVYENVHTAVPAEFTHFAESTYP